MAYQTWVALLNGHGSWLAGPGATANTTGDLEISPTPTVAIPAATSEQGDAYRITAHGIGVIGATATNATVKLWMGATAPTTGDTLLTTGAQALQASQTTSWRLEAIVTIRAIGAAATAKVWCQGIYSWSTSATAGSTVTLPGQGAALVGTALSTNAVQGLWLTSALSQTTGTTGMTCHQFLVESLN